MAKVHLVYFDLNTGYYPSFHHGLAYIVGNLRESGHSVSLSHLVDEENIGEELECIKRGKPDVIGLSFTTNQKKYVHRLFGKGSLSAKLIIAGGVHCTLVGDQVFVEFPDLDGICIGEGELALADLCSRLDKGESYTSTPSFFFKVDNKIVRNHVLPLHEIDSLPMPDYSLFHYDKIISESGRCFPMMLSRGCPYDCYYCCNHVFKKIYPNKERYVRFPSAQHAISIIKNNLQFYSLAEKITFADDTFTLNKKWLSEFCSLYKDEVGLPFLCNARVETISEEVVYTLKEAGCVSIDFGVETGNEWLRKHILNRKHSNKTIENAFAAAKKYGISRFSFNITGLPFETKEMAKDTLALNMRLQPNFGKSFYFYPYPGSKLYQFCLDYDLLLDDYEAVSGYLETPSIKEIFMSHKDIKEHQESMQTFFFARLIFSRIKIPLSIEKVLLSMLFFSKRPFLALLDPTASGRIVKKIRGLLRKIALRYLR